MKNKSSSLPRPKTSIYRRLFGKTSRELARELKVSEATLTRMNNAGQLEHLKLTSDYTGRINKKIIVTWSNIWGRCNYPGTSKYEYYGGKGIKCLLTIEDLIYLWKRDKADEMKSPSIDRLDSNGHYSIENCRFIEFKENIKSRYYKRTLSHMPTKKLLSTLRMFNMSEISRRLGFNSQTVQHFKESKACRKEKAEKVVNYLNSIPHDIFKISFEEAYEERNPREIK